MPRKKLYNSDEGFEYSLRKSLQELGQLYDILAAADGEILDGYHRERELKDLGIEPRIRRLDWCKTQKQKLAVRRQTNLARRQLSSEAKSFLINERAEELEIQGIKPLNIHKELIEEGYSQATVYRYLQSRFKPRADNKQYQKSLSRENVPDQAVKLRW